ncbi:MAG: GTP pyrophosphokinase family protein [Defluviitaleaceae bacterium]|nr:GTP pyrophosphokinase family protein [Defluviitaleaceae bacterium]MCL2835596.1 GTP pyrophosphokinase family protein [Defluviitaleaceae bacterium]
MYVVKWDEMLLPYEQAIAELSVKFRSMSAGFELLGRTSPIELVAQRVKRPSSILAKAKRKGVSLDKLEEGIEDIAGIRLICRFLEDVDAVVELVKARDGKDMRIKEERDYLRNAKKSGYRSYHIIVMYPVMCALGWKEVTCEIQIRTMVMNYWAVIEHDLQYKHDGDLPPDIRERLFRHAERTAELDKEFSSVNQFCELGETAHSRMMLMDELIKNIRMLNRFEMAAEASRYGLKLVELYEKGSSQDFLEAIAETVDILNELL